MRGPGILQVFRGFGSALWWAAVGAIVLGATGALLGVFYGAALTILNGDASAFMVRPALADEPAP